MSKRSASEAQRVSDAIRRLEAIIRHFRADEHRFVDGINTPHRPVAWCRAHKNINEAVAEWMKEYRDVVDQVREDLRDVSSEATRLLNPLKSSLVGESIRRGQLYGSKVSRASGQAKPKK